MLIYSVFLLLIMVTVFAELYLGVRRLELFEKVEFQLVNQNPLVSVIVPACNEEGSIEKALRSLCGQDYPELEVIVVNDRSTDNTTKIIKRVASDFPFVKLISIQNLEPGWLGKTHALQKGSEAASGDYLLFTDADTRLHYRTISRAVAIMQGRNLDHLSLIFKNISKGLLLNTLITDTGAGLLLVIKPWLAKRPKSRFFSGVGAFNMVKTTAYKSVGGHNAMKMQVIDDLFLGKLIKQGGFSQECMITEYSVEVPWYESVSDMINGLMKNVYALFHYRVSMAAIAVLAILAGVIGPMAGILLLEGTPRFIMVAVVLLRLAGIGTGMVATGLSPASVPFLLVTPFISLYIILKAVYLTHKNNGIVWRESYYPLKELRKQEWVLSGVLALPGLQKK